MSEPTEAEIAELDRRFQALYAETKAGLGPDASDVEVQLAMAQRWEELKRTDPDLARRVLTWVYVNAMQRYRDLAFAAQRWPTGG